MAPRRASVWSQSSVTRGIATLANLYRPGDQQWSRLRADFQLQISRRCRHELEIECLAVPHLLHSGPADCACNVEIVSVLRDWPPCKRRARFTEHARDHTRPRRVNIDQPEAVACADAHLF